MASINHSKQHHQYDNVKSFNDDSILLVACGCFSPITIGHLRMFEIARDYYVQVEHMDPHCISGLISPVSDAYGKLFLISASYRLEMCHLAITGNDNDWLRVNEWEARQLVHTLTLQVLKYLFKEERCDANQKIRLLIGSDMLKSMLKQDLWDVEDVRQIIVDYGLVVIIRESVDMNQALEIKRELLARYPNETRALILLINPLVRTDISSTQVRDLINKGNSIRYLVPETVHRYIKEKSLFSKDNKL